MCPLCEAFGLVPTGEREEGNYAEVCFANDSTGLRVAVDWMEFRPFLKIAMLGNGQFPRLDDPPILGQPNDAFDADSLLVLRGGAPSPVGTMLPSRDPAALRALLDEYAAELRLKADDVFCGDFTVFGVLDRCVDERIREFTGSS